MAGGDHHLEVHAAQLGDGVIDALAAIRAQDRLVEVEQRVGLDHDGLAHRGGRRARGRGRARPERQGPRERAGCGGSGGGGAGAARAPAHSGSTMPEVTTQAPEPSLHRRRPEASCRFGVTLAKAEPAASAMRATQRQLPSEEIFIFGTPKRIWMIV